MKWDEINPFFGPVKIYVLKTPLLEIIKIFFKLPNTSDSSKFWLFVKSKKGNFSIRDVVRCNYVQYNNRQTIVDVFADYFGSVYVTSDRMYENKNVTYMYDNYIDLPRNTESDFFNALK